MERLSHLEEAVADLARTASGGVGCEDRPTIDVPHRAELLMLIIQRVLHDAQAVHPKKSVSEDVCDEDGVSDGLWELLRVYTVYVGV